MSETLIRIGHTRKAHGAQGEVKVLIAERYLEDFAKAEVVFLNIQGKPVPFFIEDIRDAGDLLLKLEEINSPTEAKEIVSKELFLRESDVFSEEEKIEGQFIFPACIGFLLEDAERGPVGEIVDILEFPQQEMALVNSQDREIFIPLHPDLVVLMDKKSKRLVLQLPEGLLEI